MTESGPHGEAPGRPRIRVLPPELASQIAAGEVVERPASVVKELCENAVDAGARRVDVQIERGGKARLHVVDDGCGMTAAEVRLALERHATSKLRRLEDLAAISTLGFRGEALPSIASVSRMQITSRPRDAVAGVRCEATPGGPTEIREAGCAAGTTVQVADLFFNVPARLKFLKTDRTEAAHVSETILHLALAHPEVHFTLTEDGRRSLDLPRHPGLLERAQAALGRRGRGELHRVDSTRGEVQVVAALGSPLAAVASAKNVYLLVNGRGVRDRLLLRMLSSGYGALLERGRYPVAVLHLRLPEEAVDVNVHPQKVEVRFADEKAVAAAVRRAVAEGVSGAPWVTAGGVGALGAVDSDTSPAHVYKLRSAPRSAEGDGPGAAAPVRRPVLQTGTLRETFPRYGGGGGRGAYGAGLDPLTTQRAPVADGLPPDSLRRHRYLGQFLRTYLLFEGDGELLLLDQHAAHERVTYGRLAQSLAGEGVRTQRLLFPARLSVSREEELVVAEQGEALTRLGFDVDVLSGRTVAVRGVPALLADAEPETLLREVLHELLEPPDASSVERALDRAVATLACHGSVRAGQWLGEAEVAALLEALDEVERSGHCPHGRPVVVRVSEAEIRRRFHRE